MFSFRPVGCEERPVGQPGALQPAAGVRQHVRQLVWLHASGPLPVSPGPRALQGPSVRPAQEVQRPGEGLKKKKRWPGMYRNCRKSSVDGPIVPPSGRQKWTNRWRARTVGRCGMLEMCQWRPFVTRTIIRRTLEFENEEKNWPLTRSEGGF